MISVSQAVKNAYNQSTTQSDKIILNGTEYKINNVEYINDTYLDGNIFGTAIARQLSFEIETCNIEKQEFEYLTGIEVNGSIQWISLGNFITQDTQESDTIGMIKVEAMDYMLKTNIVYKSLLHYSDGTVTLYDVLQEACSLAGLNLGTLSITNGSFIVDSNQFEEGTLIRQVIQAVAQISGTVAKIKNNNSLYFINPNQVSEVSKVFTTNDYHNIDIKRYTHPINTVVLGMKDVEGENVTLRDETSVAQYGENKIVFNDNPFAYTEAKRTQLITALFNAIKGFEYKSYEIKGQSYPYMETLDKIQFKDKNENIYNSYIFRFNYKSPNGLESTTEAPSITDATVKYENIMGAEEIAKRTELIVDKQNQQITSVIENVGVQDQKIAQVTQSLEELSSQISDISEITESQETSTGTLSFENINQSEPIRIVIHPTGTNIAKLHPSPSLKPKVGLKIKTRILRFTNTTTSEVFNYEIPDDLLYYDSENYDEFILNYEGLSCVINKKCKWNADGTVGLLASTRTDEYTFPHIELTDGDYIVQVIQYSNAYIFARLMVQNYYTTQFATKAELNSEISQTKEEINLSVNQTLSNYSTTNEMNSAINLKANQINSEVNTIEENLQQVTLTADSKNRIFYSTPNPPYKLGDLWVQGSSGDILRCQTAKVSGSYSQSDWVLASKYTDNTYAQGVQSNLTNLENTISADYYTKTETDTQININTNSINSVVTEVSTLKTTVNNNYTSLKGELENYATTENVEVISNSVQALQTSTNYYIGLTQDIQENGVSKVTTEKGFTFDNDGLTIDETNAKTKSNLDTDGLVVIDKTSSNNEILLQAGYDENTGETIVKSKNMTVEKYLSIGAYSRIEDYEDELGNLGTAIFWTGG